MNYIPVTDKDRQDMLKRIGVSSIDDLFLQFKPTLPRKLYLSKPMSEIELVQHMRTLAQKNQVLKYFVGAGSYNHYIPAAINHLLMRGEFYTGYTPYQAEMSQGTLQAIYEFQTFICLLTGMDVANASLYDGSSSLAEAVLMASSYTRRNKIFVKEGLHPHYMEVLKTYCQGADLQITSTLDDSTACVVAQNPDFYGNIEDLRSLSEKAHKAGALFVVCVVEPTSLAILEPPSSFGADIVVGEGQSFGIPTSFGGSYLGFMAVKDFLLKKMPGRLCGMTKDSRGRLGFVLTLQAREQHIRREKATSNITTNVALMALAATIYLSLMGRTGLARIARLSYSRAHLLLEKLKSIGFQPLNEKPFYNEFLIKSPKPTEMIRSTLLQNGILGGLDLGNDQLLLCCTEINSLQDIERFVSIVGGAK